MTKKYSFYVLNIAFFLGVTQLSLAIPAFSGVDNNSNSSYTPWWFSHVEPGMFHMPNRCVYYRSKIQPPGSLFAPTPQMKIISTYGICPDASKLN